MWVGKLKLGFIGVQNVSSSIQKRKTDQVDTDLIRSDDIQCDWKIIGRLLFSSY